MRSTRPTDIVDEETGLSWPVKRKAATVAERRVAGAEVVQGDADAEYVGLL